MRFLLALVLGTLLVVCFRGDRHQGAARWRVAAGWSAVVVAGALLASLAWVGHAVAAPRDERALRLAADSVHLLAAGGWVGALPGLAMLFAASLTAGVSSIAFAARAARRFSCLGMVAVFVLLVSGTVNTWFLAGDVTEWAATPYGRLLLAKLTLFVAMVALAGANRARLTPRVAAGDASALRALVRNATLEAAAGLAVVAIVGVMGVTVPPAHRLHHGMAPALPHLSNPSISEHPH
jgi:putative copper resistance protein D